jgi:hypothetical protein
VPRAVNRVCARLERVAEHDVVDLRRRNSRSLERSVRRVRPELVRGEILKAPARLAAAGLASDPLGERRSRAAKEHDLFGQAHSNLLPIMMLARCRRCFAQERRRFIRR